LRNIGAFSLEQASKLSGTTERQLEYWDETGFFEPEYATENRHRPYSRVYSYRDIVGLRTLGVLRNDHNIPLQTLRVVNDWLKSNYATPWSELRFWVANKQVLFEDPDSSILYAGKPPVKSAMAIQLQEVARETDKVIERLRERPPSTIGKIGRNRHVQRNAYVIEGTRIPTWAVWNLHREGFDVASIITEYPSLTPEDVKAAIDHERSEQSNRRAG
jgi:uncharacterized protein (DUF433 family)